MASQYAVRVDLSEVLAAHAAAVHAMFPALSQAVRMTAEHAAEEWRGRVWKARLWVGEKEPYVKSIRFEMLSDFEAEVTADYPAADEIETGRPAKDLKKYLQTSKRTRISTSKKHAGQKYLIVPFRHNVPGKNALARDMPADIYARAVKLKKSILLPPGSVKPATRVSGSGHVVPQHSYKWAGRLPAGLRPKAKPYHVTDLYAGMVRMDTSSGKQNSSAYLTFRTMGEWSHHWIVPPRPGLFIARGVSHDIAALLNDAAQHAIKLGLKPLV